MTPELKNKIPADLFQNTTTSYKFFWTIGILELLKLTGRTLFELKYIIARMVSTALLVLNNHPVNLGGADHFKFTLSGLKRLYPHAWDTENGLFEALVRDINTNTIRRIIGYYTENVPYRFLTPWIGTKFVRADLSQDEVMFGLDAPYSIESRTSDRILRINPSWASAIQGNEDELISLVIDQLDKYIHSRGTSLSSDVLPNIKSLIATQDASPLSAGAIKAMIQSESVVSPFLYRGVTQTTTTTGLTKKEKPSSIIQPKPLAVTPVKREEIKPVPQKVAEPKKTDTTDVIANGKIITVRNPEILKEILPLIETNKLDAISILYKHYENVEGLQMSFMDWGALIEKIRWDNILAITKIKESGTVPAQSSTITTVVAHEEPKKTLKTEASKAKKSEWADWKDLHSSLIGISEIRNIFDEDFPSFVILGLRIDNAVLSIRCRAWSFKTDKQYIINLLFPSVTYYYASQYLTKEEAYKMGAQIKYGKYKYKIGSKIYINSSKARVLNIENL